MIFHNEIGLKSASLSASTRFGFKEITIRTRCFVTRKGKNFTFVRSEALSKASYFMTMYNYLDIFGQFCQVHVIVLKLVRLKECPQLCFEYDYRFD